MAVEPEGGLAPVRPGLAPVRTQGDIAITASEQAAYDALPDSPIGGSGVLRFPSLFQA